MYIIEKIETSSFDGKVVSSKEIIRTKSIEDKQFINAIKKEISDFIDFLVDPDLKNSEILRVHRDNFGVIYKYILWVYDPEEYPYVFYASTIKPDEFTDTILNINKWKKETIENLKTKTTIEHKTTNSNYIIA